MSERASGRARLRRVLAILVPLALYAFVLTRVSWQDELEHERAGAAVVARGRLLGEWQGDSVRFEFAGEQPDAARFPQAWSAALASGTPLAVARGEAVWRVGLRTVFAAGNRLALLPALLVVFFSQLLVVRRWQNLLRIAGCRTGFWYAARLTYLGLFFNLVVPGVTGGDLARAGLAVRDHPERKLAALTSVAVDRALGLLAVLALAAAALARLAVTDGAPRAALARIAPPVVIALGGATIAFLAWLFLPPRFAERARRLPQGERLAALLAAGREHAAHPWPLVRALGYSFANHGTNVLVVGLLARALGSALVPTALAAATTIGCATAAIPLSPGGLGVLEGAIGYLFGALGSSATLGVATALSWRLLLVVVGLAGGLVLFVPGTDRARVAAEFTAADSSPDYPP